MQLSTMGEEIDIQALQNMLHMILDLINCVYPPAVWLGQAMLTGDFLTCVACVGGGFVVFAIVMWLVSANYTWISAGLYSTSAKHDYQMEILEKSHMLGALYKREFKRYFASSVYVTNTIVSPIMGLLFAGGMLFVGPEQLEGIATEFYAESGMMLQVRNMLPMALAMIFCMMPLTAVSISMEGKQWWIVKTLPIRAKDLLDSKLLMNLSVLSPFYLLSVILVSIGQRVSLMEFVWILLVPLVAMLFACVFGQTVNLKLPVFDWENEVSVVKQSASMLVGGIVPFFVMMGLTLGVMMIPAQYINVCMLLFCLVVGAVTFVLYRKNSRVDLINI
jgi:ABC-2 type transport system permease protein